MQAIRKINNNAALCLDSAGRLLVALGAGVGFGAVPHEVDLASVEHTFYAVDAKYLALIQDLPEREFSLAARLVDAARPVLAYDLGPNVAITLADHLAFALERARQGMEIEMPLAYDVRRAYPREYELALAALGAIGQEFGVALPTCEAAGIALHYVNAGACCASAAEKPGEAAGTAASRATSPTSDDALLAGVVALVEEHMAVRIPKNTFDFARFATHIHYLLDRLREGTPFDTRNRALIASMRAQLPKEVACAEDIARYLERTLATPVIEEETIYVAMHITRVCDRLTSA